jgi:hypothetical protein
VRCPGGFAAAASTSPRSSLPDERTEMQRWQSSGPICLTYDDLVWDGATELLWTSRWQQMRPSLVACVLVASTAEAFQDWRCHGGWLRGFLEEADRQLGGTCWLDLGAGSPATDPIQPADGDLRRGLELRSGRGSIGYGGRSYVRGRMGHGASGGARSGEAVRCPGGFPAAASTSPRSSLPDGWTEVRR